MKFMGWRKVMVALVLVLVGVALELLTKKGLSTNMLELLKWTGISYLGANAIKPIVGAVMPGPKPPPPQ